MIHSMTAYARVEHKAEWGNASWEIRSVNQRYLETYIRLPETMRSLEPTLRERLRKRLNRGKVEVNLRLDIKKDDGAGLSLNEGLAKQLLQSAEWLHGQTQSAAQINLVDVLRWPGVMSADEQDMDSVGKELMQQFDKALDDFVAARAREGEAINEMLQTRLSSIEEQSAFCNKRMPEILQWQREKLSNRLAEIKDELDPARIEQEMILLAQKMDVAEEIDRLDAHVTETRRILKKGGACGRRLDFMMQEFNRESNTLASKSISSDITASAVELKVLIEQMREQIQNLE
ncbi:YicC/YloC family endoribonuclease [Paraferrimonas sedimenticola]|uniref:YicC family protein n=1 Tax=Paraferrimonas sedimenticola TaxID=375674 RepID=A0AA37RSY0_9GAMM|nr:YicC/YloC family endoribonuclease [Paraferrimonas sedimenticola]GLP95340.1 hypothetical protein GCM10007895_06460 [Paraferrimonas sedimenticola]